MPDNHPKPIPEISASHRTRFMSSFVAGDISECWLWKGTRDNKNYGIFHYDGSPFRANRIAYFVKHGIDPGPNLVCHRCDNPPCVNPDHLFLGTAKDNADDRKQKGRALFGEGHPRVLLNESKVHQIRDMYRLGMTFSEIGRIFCVHKATARKVALCQLWKHI